MVSEQDRPDLARRRERWMPLKYQAGLPASLYRRNLGQDRHGAAQGIVLQIRVAIPEHRSTVVAE